MTLQEHLSLDDSDFIFHIKRWCDSEDAILSDLSRRFLNRKLFKAFDIDMTDDSREQFVRQVNNMASEKGLSPEYYVIEDRGGDVNHSFYAPDDTHAKDRIFVEDGFSHPQIREISEVSSAVRGLQKGYRIHRLNFPAEMSEQVAALYHR